MLEPLAKFELRIVVSPKMTRITAAITPGRKRATVAASRCS